jgi:hypothetical protein
LTRTLTVDPEPLRDVPEALALVVCECLARNPEGRPRSMVVLADRLREALPSCAPWGRADAQQWWQAHPRPASTAVAASQATFFPVGRRLTGSGSGTSAEDRPR